MQLKTDELTSQIKLLETLFANYEIQQVVGEISDETYQRAVLLFTIGLDTAKTELETITQATMQLCGPVPTVQAPVMPDLPVTESAIEAPATIEAAVESVETSTLVETPFDSTAFETTSFEAEPAPVEEPVMDLADVAEAPIEEVLAEEPVMESTIDVVEDAPVEEPVMDAAVFEDAPVEEPVMDAAVFEEAPVEEPVMESSFVEEVAPFVSVEADGESLIEITTTEPVFLTSELAVEAPIMESAFVEDAPLETVAMDLPVEEVSIDLVEEQPIADVADVPLQVFEVTEQVAVEQTLEKVMEQLNSPAVEALAVEELSHSSHPTSAPLQALSEITAEAVSDGTIDESDEDTTE
jgi:hypothetical protein